MDNEKLLEWSEYEVGRAREVLYMATRHMRELREVVRLEKKAKRELEEFKMRGVEKAKATGIDTSLSASSANKESKEHLKLL